MGTITYQIPVAGQPNSTEDAKVATALTTLLTWANGNIDTNNLSPSAAIVAAQLAAAVGQSAGINQAGQTVKGAVNIAASESRTNVAYGTLATPDQVTGIVLPSNGLIAVWYQATWQDTSNGGRAAIFIGANQLKVANDLAAGTVATQAAAMDDAPNPNANHALTSHPLGLLGVGVTAGAFGGDVTTGQAVGAFFTNGVKGGQEIGGSLQTLSASTSLGGPCMIFAAAGTYTVSVQFKATAGTVTASNRKLWVQAISFT